MAKRLKNFLCTNDILTMHQFGFRKSYSTELAIVDMYDHLLEKLDNKDYTCAIFLDLAKAFDSVNHSILLAKLQKYGVREIALKFFESYLSNRWQYVKILNQESDLRLIDIGVPQGSILGPLLFLLYINDLPNATDCFVKLFADDTFLSLSCQKKADLQKKANIEIENIRKWLFANKLTLNVDKSKFMIISRRRDANHSFSLKINGEAVGRCSTYKYLGLIIDDKLDWKSHVNYICKKVSKA